MGRKKKEGGWEVRREDKTRKHCILAFSPNAYVDRKCTHPCRGTAERITAWAVSTKKKKKKKKKAASRDSMTQLEPSLVTLHLTHPQHPTQSQPQERMASSSSSASFWSHLVGRAFHKKCDAEEPGEFGRKVLVGGGLRECLAAATPTPANASSASPRDSCLFLVSIACSSAPPLPQPLLIPAPALSALISSHYRHQAVRFPQPHPQSLTRTL